VRAVRCLDQVGQRHAEGERLARPGRRLDEYVMAGQDVFDDELLDGERRGYPALAKGALDRARYAEFGERHVVQLLM
jgi:hypothetical protein